MISKSIVYNSVILFNVSSITLYTLFYVFIYRYIYTYINMIIYNIKHTSEIFAFLETIDNVVLV